MVHDLHQLHRAALDHLVQDVLGVEEAGTPSLIRVEAADVVDGARLEGGKQVVQVGQVVAAHGVQPLPGEHISALGVGHAADQRLGTIAQQCLHLRHQGVVVLINPPTSGVGHIPCIVPDLEAVVQRWAIPTSVCPQLEGHDRTAALDLSPVDVLAELQVLVLARPHQVLDGSEAVLVQNLHDALDALYHRLVVWELPLADVQPLLRIGPLLGFENLLDEELLQPLVRQVDAELLEAVCLQALKSIDVQCADAVVVDLSSPEGHLPRGTVAGAGCVDVLDDLVEEALVEDLDDALQRLSGLRLGPWAVNVRRAPVLSLHVHLLPLQHLLQAALREAQEVRRLRQRVLPVLRDLDLGLLRGLRRVRPGGARGPGGVVGAGGEVVELHFAEMDQRRHGLPDVLLHVRADEGGQRLAELGKLLRVPLRVRGVLWARLRAARVEQLVLRAWIQQQLVKHVIIQAKEHFVENVVVPLAVLLGDHARGLQ
mmetsp:Transcript_77324/g.226765  ORF Transcript_77324/g.226765 Transcript_77324/m.226765 type:complete len:484 (+) Transcript_77324:2140-3591(+)